MTRADVLLISTLGLGPSSCYVGVAGPRADGAMMAEDGSEGPDGGETTAGYELDPGRATLQRLDRAESRITMRHHAREAFVVAAVESGAVHADELASRERRPQPIVNGFETEPCQFPSAVAMLAASGGSFCTGTLVHPEIVLYAAHCHAAREATHVLFGERVDAPARTVATAGCERFPGFESSWLSVDLAFCRLAESVEDVPIIPIANGCELDEIQVGDLVTIVGFGASDADLEDDGTPTNLTGVGIKRYTRQHVEEIDVAANDLVLVGPGTSACFGDSGGPVLLELPDGSWRVLGAASTRHPDVLDSPDACGYGAVYELAFTEIDWLEQTTGVDLSPCHEVDGRYAPGDGCRPVPAAPQALGASWSDGCSSADVVEVPFCQSSDIDPPRIEWVTPTADVATDVVPFEASIALDVVDDGSGVTAVWLSIDGEDQPVVLETPPFSFGHVVFPQGRFSLEARARDRAGNVGVAETRAIEVGMAAEHDGESSGPAVPDDDSSTGTDRDDTLPSDHGRTDGDTGCAMAPRHGAGPSAPWWLVCCCALSLAARSRRKRRR